MTLDAYAARLAVHTGYGIEGVIVGLVLLARHARVVGAPPTVLTMHRLLLACVVVGSKANFDVFYKNLYMARAGGVPLNEMNLLELELLLALHYTTTPVEEAEIESLLRTIPAMLEARVDPDVMAHQLLSHAAPAPPVGAPAPPVDAPCASEDSPSS
jgi:hypothetical protein